MGRQLRLQRHGSERGAVRGAATPGRDGEVVGDFTTKKRVFGALHPSTGIDWPYFENTAKKEGLEVAQTVEYTVAL